MTWPKSISKGMFPDFEEQIKKQKEKLMPNGDGECNDCGGLGTPTGFDHKEDCPVLQGQRRIDILTGKRMSPEEIKDWADGIAKECAEDTDKTTLVREEE